MVKNIIIISLIKIIFLIFSCESMAMVPFYYLYVQEVIT